MSDKSKLVKTIVDNTIEKRRDLQFEEMKRWDSGKITGIEAIENILQIEKLIFFNMKESKDELKGKKDG
jgi:hypothetical protein